MAMRTGQANFSKGVISDELVARIDVAAYASGLRRADNVILLKYGGVTKRPGTRLVAEVYADQGVRLMPFQFSLAQTYVLEMGQGYMRPAASGGLILEDRLTIAGIVPGATKLLCYLMLGGLSVIGLKRWPRLLPAAAVALALGYGAFKFVRTGQALMVTGPMPGLLLVAAFLAGVSLYWFRDRLPYSRSWCIGMAIASVVLLSVVPFGDVIAPFTAAYVTIWLGLTDPRRVWLVRGADYSYGIFLYGFPMQQAVAALGIWGQSPLGNFVGSVLAAAAFAGVSWTFIEKPALRLRKPMERLEARWLGRNAVKPVAAPADEPGVRDLG